jgi:hypothetical protein
LQSNTRTSPVALDSTKIALGGISSKRPAGTPVTADCPNAPAANFQIVSLFADGCAPDQRHRL